MSIPTTIKETAEAVSIGVESIGKNDRTLHVVLSFFAILALLLTIWHNGVQQENQRKDFLEQIRMSTETTSRSLDKLSDQF